MFQQIGSLVAAAAAVSLPGLFPEAALADTTEERRERGAAVIRSLNNGTAQPALERMRKEFPFLAQATGPTRWATSGRARVSTTARAIAPVAAFAAMGEMALMKVHAGYALNIGIPEEELKEVIHMVTVPAGLPKAIASSQVLSQLFKEGRQADGGGPAEQSHATAIGEEARP